MRFIITLFLALQIPLAADHKPNAIVHAELKAQLIAVELEIQQLLASGLGNTHPKVKKLTDHTSELKKQIQAHKPAPQETILLLTGTESTSLTGEKTSLAKLLKTGWRIHQIIPAGENKAYAWLKK